MAVYADPTPVSCSTGIQRTVDQSRSRVGAFLAAFQAVDTNETAARLQEPSLVAGIPRGTKAGKSETSRGVSTVVQKSLLARYGHV